MFPNNRKVIEGIIRRIAEVQDSDITEQRCKEVEKLIKDLEEVWLREEKYWFQRSRIKWLADRDKNSKFFHQITVQRRRMNKILCIKDENGRWIEEESEIQENLKNFDTCLFKTVEVKDWSGVV